MPCPRGIIFIIILMAALLSVMCALYQAAHAETVEYAADMPTTNADGTPYLNRSGAKVYFRLLPDTLYGAPTATLVTTAPTVTYRATFNRGGTWCSVWTAFNATGVESGLSNEVCMTIISLETPSAPVLVVAHTLAPLVSFSTTTVGRTSYGDIKWTNTSASLVSVVSVTFSNPAFSMTTIVPVILSAGGDGRVGLKFKPTALGKTSARAVAVLSTGETIRFILTGTGR